MARSFVLGFFPSISASMRRFRPMAAVLAPTMAIRIQNMVGREGMPRAASTAPVSAKGSAKTVWENRIVSRKSRSEARTPGVCGGAAHGRLASPFFPSIPTPFRLSLIHTPDNRMKHFVALQG